MRSDWYALGQGPRIQGAMGFGTSEKISFKKLRVVLITIINFLSIDNHNLI